jgi:hypothetical protein
MRSSVNADGLWAEASRREKKHSTTVSASSAALVNGREEGEAGGQGREGGFFARPVFLVRPIVQLSNPALQTG